MTRVAPPAAPAAGLTAARDRASDAADRALATVRPWVEPAARAGYVAKGIVYLVIGGLAAAAAFHRGGELEDQEGALATVLGQSNGRVLLALLALGLAGHSLWRLVQALADPEDLGREPKALLLRAYFLVSSFAHGALVVAAIRMLDGAGGARGDETPQRTAEVMNKPFGRWLVALIGLAVLGAAAYQLARAYNQSFTRKLDLGRLDPEAARWVVRFGRVGLAARGIVFGMMGTFLLNAAIQARPGEAKGLEGALRTLQTSSQGPWLLGIVALGLCAYGAYQIVKAFLRRVG
jgi:hypothetical protein